MIFTRDQSNYYLRGKGNDPNDAFRIVIDELDMMLASRSSEVADNIIQPWKRKSVQEILLFKINLISFARSTAISVRISVFIAADGKKEADLTITMVSRI